MTVPNSSCPSARTAGARQARAARQMARSEKAEKMRRPTVVGRELATMA
jgi:hypothetical protein